MYIALLNEISGLTFDISKISYFLIIFVLLFCFSGGLFWDLWSSETSGLVLILSVVLVISLHIFTQKVYVAIFGPEIFSNLKQQLFTESFVCCSYQFGCLCFLYCFQQSSVKPWQNFKPWYGQIWQQNLWINVMNNFYSNFEILGKNYL